MNILTLFEITATFIESYLCYRLNDLFLKQEMDKRRTVILSMMLTLVIFIINTYSLFSAYTLVIAILFVSIATCLFFKTDFYYTFYISTFYGLCLLFFDFFSITIIGVCLHNKDFAAEAVKGESVYRFAFLLLSKFSLLLSYLVIRKFLKAIQNFKSEGVLFVTAFGYIGVIYFSRLTFAQLDFNTMISWFLLLLIVVLSVFSLAAYMSCCREAEEKIIISMRNQVIAENYKEVSKSYKENAQLYHDMKNHIVVLHELMENKKYDQINHYLKSMTEISSTFEDTWTGNEVMDCIINIKRNVCEGMNIDLTIDSTPVVCELDIFAISTIIPNLLDNAIEACAKCDLSSKWIAIAIRQINEMVIIAVENSICEIPVIENNELQTSKYDKHKHGWGIKSVESMVKKEGGVFDYSFDTVKSKQ